MQRRVCSRRLESKADLTGADPARRVAELTQRFMDPSLRQIVGSRRHALEHDRRPLVRPRLVPIPLAEEMREIAVRGPLGAHRSTAFAQLAERQHPLRVPPPRSASTSTSSPRQLRIRASLTVRHAPRRANNLDRDVTMELTESSLVDGGSLRHDRLAEIRAVGVNIVADDFGSGYVSIAALGQLPFTGVKIDMSLVEGISDGVGHQGRRAGAIDRGLRAQHRAVGRRRGHRGRRAGHRAHGGRLHARSGLLLLAAAAARQGRSRARESSLAPDRVRSNLSSPAESRGAASRSCSSCVAVRRVACLYRHSTWWKTAALPRTGDVSSRCTSSSRSGMPTMSLTFGPTRPEAVDQTPYRLLQPSTRQGRRAEPDHVPGAHSVSPNGSADRSTRRSRRRGVPDAATALSAYIAAIAVGGVPLIHATRPAFEDAAARSRGDREPRRGHGAAHRRRRAARRRRPRRAACPRGARRRDRPRQLRARADFELHRRRASTLRCTTRARAAPPVSANSRSSRTATSSTTSHSTLTRLEFDHDDTTVSWLPLVPRHGPRQRRHDEPARRDRRPPPEPVRLPRRSRGVAPHDRRGARHVTVTPNFGLDHAVRRIKPESIDGIDLSCWTRCPCGPSRSTPARSSGSSTCSGRTASGHRRSRPATD